MYGASGSFSLSTIVGVKLFAALVYGWSSLKQSGVGFALGDPSLSSKCFDARTDVFVGQLMSASVDDVSNSI